MHLRCTSRLVLVSLLVSLSVPNPARADEPSRDESAAADAGAPASAREASKALARGPVVIAPPPSRFGVVHIDVSEHSERRDLTLYIHRGTSAVRGPAGFGQTDVYDLLCRVPCEPELAAGSLLFGVSSGSRTTVKTERRVRIQPGDHLSVRYDSRLGVRVAGWAVLFAGVVPGTVLIEEGTHRGESTNTGFVVGGSLLTAVGLIAGLWLANTSDRASVAALAR